MKNAKDVCECGDYRDQHDAQGRCLFNKPNGMGHHGAPNCVEFRLSRIAGPITTEQLDKLQFGKPLHERRHPSDGGVAGEPLAWLATHPDHGPNFGTMANTQQGATSRLMMTGIAGDHGWSIIPLYATPLVRKPLGRETVPLADHDEIGRKVINQPWEIQKAIVTIAAHCLVLKDNDRQNNVSDLAGCISQCCLDLANALSPVPGNEERAVNDPQELEQLQRKGQSHARSYRETPHE